jgi:hypothetical protein
MRLKMVKQATPNRWLGKSTMGQPRRDIKMPAWFQVCVLPSFLRTEKNSVKTENLLKFSKCFKNKKKIKLLP